jgi:hypothetical protein
MQCNHVIIRTEFVRALGGFPTGPAFRSIYGGEDAVFRHALNKWSQQASIETVYYIFTARAGSHFDVHRDEAEGAPRHDPEAWEAFHQASRAYFEWVDRRMRRSTRYATE